jgi:tetratricopeptide (TPR) repeat protein
MGERILLGRGVSRFVYALAREVSGDDLNRAGQLLSDLWRQGALKSEGEYSTLNLDVAAERVRQWLSPAEQAKLHAPSFAACKWQWPMLAAWDAAGVALPAGHRVIANSAWFSALEAEGLVRNGPDGYLPEPRLRLLVWLSRDEIAALPTPSPGALALWSAGLRELRRRGRWQDAGRLARALIDRLPAHPEAATGWRITAAIGFVQLQDYPRAQALLADSSVGSSAARLPQAWRIRFLSLESFVQAELGDLKRAGELAQEAARRARGTREQIWPLLARSWSDILSGRYRRAERVLAFLDRRVARPDWLCSIITAWCATTDFYLERFDSSRDHYARALDAARRAGWHDRLFTMLGNRAMNDIDMGEFDRARPVLFGLRGRHERLGSVQLLSRVWTEIGRLLARTDRPGLALRAGRCGIDLGIASQSWMQAAHAHMGIGIAARAAGNWNLAAHHFSRASALAAEAGSVALAGSADLQLSRAEHYAGHSPRALALLDSACHLFDRTGQDSRLADAHRQAAEFLLETGDLDRAEARLDLAERIYAGRAWVREATWAGLLRVELALRRAPRAVTEAEIESIDLGRTVTPWQTTHASGLLSLGFALLDDWRSAHHYARETVASSRVTADLYLNRRLYNLASGLASETPAASRLAEFWGASMRLPEPGKGTP